MPKRHDVEVQCPSCGEPVKCWMDPGEPMVRYYPDGSGYPGSPPGVGDFEKSCDCEETSRWEASLDVDALTEMEDELEAAYEEYMENKMDAERLEEDLY